MSLPHWVVQVPSVKTCRFMRPMALQLAFITGPQEHPHEAAAPPGPALPSYASFG